MPGIEIKGRSKIANYRHGGRIGLGKGSRRTKRQAAASEIFKAKAKSKGGETDFDFSGYPQTSKYRKALTKHEKKFPKLTKNIEYNVSKLVPKYEKGPHKVKPSPRHTQKRADGGRIGLKHGKVPFWKFWGGAQKKIEERKYKTIEGMKGSGLKITDEQKKYLETHKARGGRIGLKKGGNK